MREIERIDRITEKLNEVWHKYPDMRFWQLMLNMPWDFAGDPWFMEDNITEKAFDKVRKEGL